MTYQQGFGEGKGMSINKIRVSELCCNKTGLSVSSPTHTHARAHTHGGELVPLSLEGEGRTKLVFTADK